MKQLQIISDKGKQPININKKGTLKKSSENKLSLFLTVMHL
jgi:hypothetical protein